MTISQSVVDEAVEVAQRIKDRALGGDYQAGVFEIATVTRGVLLLSEEIRKLREERPFSIEELAELCSVTHSSNVVHDVLSEPLRAKLVQMWNEASRGKLLRISESSK